MPSEPVYEYLVGADIPTDGEDGSAPGPNFVHLLAHADRCWKAEEVNATRIGTRANLVLSGITALIGLKLFAIGKELDAILVSHAVVQLLFGQLALISLFCLAASLLRVLGVWSSRKPKPTDGEVASGSLSLDPVIARYPDALPDSEVVRLLFKTTYNAASDLRERNISRKKDVDHSQRWFLWAAAALLLSIGLYCAVYCAQTAERNRTMRVEGRNP